MAIATRIFSYYYPACVVIAFLGCTLGDGSLVMGVLGDGVWGQRASAQDAIEEVLREVSWEFTQSSRQVSRPVLSRPVRYDELGDPLPPQARFQFGSERFVAQDPIYDLALSPDGSVLITRDSDHITCWEAASGKIRWKAAVELQVGAAYGQRAFAFTAKGEGFYAQSEPEKLQKWNVATGKSAAIPVKHTLPLLPENRPVNLFPGAVSAVDVTRDGSRIAAAGGHGVVVYDAAGNSLLEISNKPELAVEATDWRNDPLLMSGHYSLPLFSPDAKTLAVVTSDKPRRVRLCDAMTGEIRHEFELPSRLVRMAFSPDGKSLGTTERSGAVCQFSVATAEREWKYDPPEHIVQGQVILELGNALRDDMFSTAIAYSPDGEMVAVARLRQIYVLNAASGAVQSELDGHTQMPWSLAFSSDSKTLYSAGLDRIIRRWDVPNAIELPLEKGFHGSGIVASTAVTNRMAVCDSSGNIRITTTNAKPSEKETCVIKVPRARISAVALSRDGVLVASAFNEAENLIVAVWNAESAEAVQRWQWNEKEAGTFRIGTLEFSPDGTRLSACVNGGGKAHLLDVKTGKQIAELEHPSICGLSFDRTGAQLVTAGANERLCFWDSGNGELVKTKEMIGGDLQNVRCSPVEDLIVTAHFPNVLRIWNAKDMTLRKRAPLSGEANFDALAFSADGNWLATGSSGVVNILNSRTAERVWQAGSHHGAVLTLGFAEGDKVLISGGTDGMVYGWELTPQDNAAARDYNQVWSTLCSGTEEEIKNLKWELVQIGDAAVDEVEQRLKPITRVVNLRAIAKGVDRETAASRVRLAMQLSEKNPAVEIDLRIKHAIDFLALLRSPKSLALLKELAATHESKDIRKEAMFALETIQ
ncbi:MAG: WD40 repeat domain-containing protein [Pirellulaceae bacterium]|nr:WD40 repeat domain-containing protein [Pirellulaceae bacterium]